MLTKLVLASHNAHKIEEVQAILSPLGITVIGATEAGLTDVEETGTTFEENALLKARAGYAQTGLPTLADDSGLCINALGGAPGLYSARFAQKHGGYPAVFNTVWEQMGDNPDRTAYFICCMALVTGPNSEHLFIGKMTGRIAPEASGIHLFGYDPIFIPDGYDVTCGVLDSDIKNKISHRAKALEKLLAYLKQS